MDAFSYFPAALFASASTKTSKCTECLEIANGAFGSHKNQNHIKESGTEDITDIQS